MMQKDEDLISNNESRIDSLLKRDDKALKTQNENLYNVVSKVVLLGVIMIVTSQMVLGLSLANWMANTYYNDTLTIIYAWIKGFHTFIASLSVFLGFEFTHDWYIFCCHRCHTKTSNAIQDNNDDIFQSLQYLNK